MVAGERIVAELRQRQKQSGLPDYKFGPSIGVSAELWRSVNKNNRPVTSWLAYAAARAYPELDALVTAFLRHELPLRAQRQGGGGFVRA